MPHKNRNWHLRWTIDAKLHRVTHRDGLMFSFRELPSGDIEVTPENPLTLVEQAGRANGGDAERVTQQRVQRLIYEAQEAVRRALSRPGKFNDGALP